MSSGVPYSVDCVREEKGPGDPLDFPRAFLKSRQLQRGCEVGECKEEELLLELDLVDVKYWVDAAIDYLRVCGKEVALAEFSNSVGRFVKAEMYIFALDETGRMVAHGANIRYVGRDFYNVQDTDGSSFVKFIVDTANEQGFGWVEYNWPNPRSGKVEPKMAYCEKYGDTIVCCGIHI